MAEPIRSVVTITPRGRTGPVRVTTMADAIAAAQRALLKRAIAEERRNRA
jgi:hypothetical protein